MKTNTQIIIAAITIIVAFLALGLSKSQLDSLISNDKLSKTAVVSVSVRDASTGRIVYQRDADLLLHPASTLKAFTSPVILKYLGQNYEVKTSLYRDENGLYLKLSGDPLLTSKDLNRLFEGVATSSLTIDDSAIDDVEWGVGWMWDDETNPLMPKFSAYNLDHNLEVRDGVAVPVKSPKEHFLSQLAFKGRIKTGKVPENAQLVGEISHSILEEVENINKNSDNLAAETLLKLVGGKYSNSTGTTESGLEVFRDFYTGIGADPSELFIVDASGVSHNDLIQANWMTLALHRLYNLPEFKTYPETLAKPGEKGTLKNRLHHMRGRLWSKTGSNAGVSGITGYIKAKSGRMYAFAILIQNFKGTSAPTKRLEDRILNELYAN